MTTRMLVNATEPNELRIAIVEDGELNELDIEAAEQSSIKGNIYKGIVHNVEGSLAAAFVDFGAHKQGFLPLDEVSPAAYARKWTQSEPPKINDVLRRGQEIVVQVSKDAIGEKGAALTTYLSLPGRYTVLMPGSDASGISRKIEDEKVRRRIKAMAQKITRPEGSGFIVRTAGLGQTRTAIQRDIDALTETYERISKAATIARAPSLLHAEPDLVSRTLRDFYDEDIDEVWIDSKEEYEAAVAYFEALMPQDVVKLHHYQNAIPIFAYYHVEEQIEATFERRVALPSGGSIVIDETEALVAIDVNSGKMTSEKGHEETVSKTNMEAAEEIARQLKLRDLGGIVVIDFIDMELAKNKKLVETALAEAAAEDKARYKISRINSKGLCVLTRQRIRQGLRRAFQRRCDACGGTGWLRTPEAHSLSLLRRVETRLAQGGVGEARVSTHRETAEYILNQKRTQLLALEREYGCRILVTVRSEMDRGKDDVLYLSKGEVLAEITDKLPPREERRVDRSKKRRARKKRGGRGARTKDLPETDATENTQAASGAAPSGAPSKNRDEGGEKTSRRKKRTRKPRREGASGTPGTGSAESGDLLESAPTEGGVTFTGRPSPEMLERLKAERKARMLRRSQDPVVPEGAGAPSEGTPGASASAKATMQSDGARTDAISTSSAPPVPAAPAQKELYLVERDAQPRYAGGSGALPPNPSQSPDDLDRRALEEQARARKSLLERIFGGR